MIRGLNRSCRLNRPDRWEQVACMRQTTLWNVQHDLEWTRWNKHIRLSKTDRTCSMWSTSATPRHNLQVQHRWPSHKFQHAGRSTQSQRGRWISYLDDSGMPKVLLGHLLDGRGHGRTKHSRYANLKPLSQSERIENKKEPMDRLSIRTLEQIAWRWTSKMLHDHAQFRSRRIVWHLQRPISMNSVFAPIPLNLSCAYYVNIILSYLFSIQHTFLAADNRNRPKSAVTKRKKISSFKDMGRDFNTNLEEPS